MLWRFLCQLGPHLAQSLLLGLSGTPFWDIQGQVEDFPRLRILRANEAKEMLGNPRPGYDTHEQTSWEPEPPARLMGAF